MACVTKEVSGDHSIETGWSPTGNDRTGELYNQDEVGHRGGHLSSLFLQLKRFKNRKR